MIDGAAVLGVLLVYIPGVAMPGPNFVAVAHKAASSTRREALAMVFGIVIVNLFWASCAILGVGLVFAAFPWIALFVKLAGAAYLIWFGMRLVVKARSNPVAAAGSGISSEPRHAFAQGFATNIANPKSMAFFAAVFASATPAHVSPATFAAMLGVVGVVATCWYGMVALVLSHKTVALRYRSGKAWIDRVCGSVIVLLGVRQLLR